MLARAQRLHVGDNTLNLRTWSLGFPYHQHVSLCWFQASPKSKKNYHALNTFISSYFLNSETQINDNKVSSLSRLDQNSTVISMCVSHITPDLWWLKAEGGCVDVSFVTINKMQTFRFSKTQISSSSNMAQSKRLGPACMPATPAGK